LFLSADRRIVLDGVERYKRKRRREEEDDDDDGE